MMTRGGDSTLIPLRRIVPCTASDVGSRTRHIQRFAYQQIDEVLWEPGSRGLSNEFFVKLFDNTGFFAHMKRAPTGFAAYVEKRVSELERPVLLERHLPLDEEGHGV